MAEAAAFDLAKTVLAQLTSLALDEFRLIWGHKEQLEKLKDTIATIRDVLQDAERRQANDAAVQGWLARLRAALYEADDLFDMISAKILHEKAKEVNFSLLKPYNFAFVVKAAHKVKAIRGRLDDIARDISQFNFLPNQADQEQQSYRIEREQTHSYVRSNKVEGLDQEREDVVKMLLPRSEQNGVHVIAVIGIGGSGKTTLAQLVYNDERIQQGFDMCLWACINYFSDLRRVLVGLVESATNSSEHKDQGVDQLQALFREDIEEKRVLLVLDDVWDENPWNWYKLKILLESGKGGSMVLATTRSVNVAQSLVATKPYYMLNGMSDGSAWLLFKKIVFGEGDEESIRDLEQLGRQIVEKCANNPLAIVTIASLLRHKEKKKWFALVNDELSTVVPDEYKKITHALKISYNDLPSQVKRCFAYCSLFPKEYEFEKDRLVRLWIAQGFVEPISQSLEDTAEEYLLCLVERCFLQDMKARGIKGAIRHTYKMHDLVLGLAKEVAESECILVDQIAHSSWDKTLRHVSLNCKSESLVDRVRSFSHSKNLRTFLWLNKISMEKNALKKLMESFKALRVLDLSRLEIKDIPASVGQLIHLRFLDLSENIMEMIPSSICSLHHLQSLILQGCQCLQELPKDLENLLSLRHLVLEGCDKLSRMPPGLAALKSLVTLDRLVVHNPSGGLSYLECLDNLSGSLNIDLPITGWKNATTDAARSCLSRKSRLHALTIQWKSETEVEEDLMTVMNALEPHPNLEHLHIWKFGGKEIPPWVTCIRSLVILTVESCGRCVEFPPLSHLPSLKELYILNMSSMVYIEDYKLYKPDSFFPSLETLQIWNVPNLKSWWLQAPTMLPSFPRVTKVNIRNCQKLKSPMPLFPLVEHLKLESVREELIWKCFESEATGHTSCKTNVLKRLRISRIRGLRRITEAQTKHLSNLQKLSVYRCEQLETVSCIGLADLTSLEKLKVTACEKIKWVDVDERRPKVPWGYLPRLKYLEISTVDVNLCKEFKYLASLQILKVCTLNQEFHLVKGVQHLTSLQQLTLTDCKELFLSWRAILSLGCLQILTLSSVEKVTDVDSSMAQIQRSSLRELKIYSCSATWLHGVPWKSLTSLQYVHLSRIPHLQALPEGIQHLTALQQLKIMVCKSVVLLPNWMRYLTSLRYLEIRGSSEELKKRCEKQRGEDWPVIQHIQEIIIT